MAVAGLYLFLDCTCLCALHRRLETTHKGSLLPAPCLYVSVRVDINEKYHQRHKKNSSHHSIFALGRYTAEKKYYL